MTISDQGANTYHARLQDTPVYCETLVQAHAAVHYWRQESRDIYATVNDMATKARGKWVRFCDGDPLIAGSTRRLTETGNARVYVAHAIDLSADQDSISISAIAETVRHLRSQSPPCPLRREAS
jgi:hypothetical protein